MDPEAFFHIRLVLSMITSLAVARLLTGLARFVQHPKREAIYVLHIVWVGLLLIAVLRFWWFEYALTQGETLTFTRFAFVSGFATLHFLLATLLFPDDIREYDGFRGYFEARRSWFFGLLALLFAIDMIDTWLKGDAYINLTSPGYPFPSLCLIAGALLSVFISNRIWNFVFLTFALSMQIVWILWHLTPIGLT